MDSSSGNIVDVWCVCVSGSGQIQLWQFLLELLSDSSNSSCITWEGTNGEFKMTDPDERWRGAGAGGRASPTWTTTSWAEPCATTTTRTSWPKCTAALRLQVRLPRHRAGPAAASAWLLHLQVPSRAVLHELVPAPAEMSFISPHTQAMNVASSGFFSGPGPYWNTPAAAGIYSGPRTPAAHMPSHLGSYY